MFSNHGIAERGVAVHGVASRGLVGSGGAILPPSQVDILQWGTGATDGLIVDDKKSPLIVEPEAAYVNRPVVIFDGVGDRARIPGVIPNASSSYELTADWSGVTNGRRSGGTIDADNRMYIQKFDATTLRCTIGAFGNTIDVPYVSGFVKICLEADGDVFADGVLIGNTGGNISVTGTYPLAIGAAQSGSGFVEYSEIIVADAVIDGSHLTFEETEGTVLYDVSSNDNDGTITTTSGLATMRAARADGVSSWCALNGFRLSGSLQIPALADGSAAADGGAITNPGGYISNGADVDIVQTDADFTILGGASFFGNGVFFWNDKTRADFLAFVNGTDNLWLQWEKVLGVCMVKKWVQYDVTDTLNESQYNQLVRWAGDPTCGGGTIPFP